MRALQAQGATRPPSSTANGSPLWFSAISSRMAAKTVYLGNGPEIVLPKPSAGAARASSRRRPSSSTRCCSSCAPCRSSTSAGRWATTASSTRSATSTCPSPTPRTTASPTSGRAPWARSRAGRPGPEFIMIDIPEEHQLRMQILTHPRARHQHRPRHRLHRRVQEGVPAPGDVPRRPARHARPARRHQGRARPRRAPRASSRRTACSCSASPPPASPPGRATSSASTPTQGEGTWVAQDDIVFLQARRLVATAPSRASTSRPTWTLKLQEAMYHALTHKSALLENVMVNGKGEIDFLDERLGENGRGVLDRARAQGEARRQAGLDLRRLDQPAAARGARRHRLRLHHPPQHDHAVRPAAHPGAGRAGLPVGRVHPLVRHRPGEGRRVACASSAWTTSSSAPRAAR